MQFAILFCYQALLKLASAGPAAHLFLNVGPGWSCRWRLCRSDRTLNTLTLVLIDFFDVESSNLVMASASSTSAKNLFQDSKRRLAERVQVNINNVGSVTRQVQRGSRSHDMLAQTARNFCQTETTMENTFNNLQKMQVLMAQLNQQENSIDNNLRHLPDIREQIRDMQR